MPGFHSKSSQACDAKLFLFIASSKGANDSQPLLQVNSNKQDGQAEMGPMGGIPMDKRSGSLGIKGLSQGWHPGKQLSGKAENSFVSTFGNRLAVQLEIALLSPAVVPAAEGCLQVLWILLHSPPLPKTEERNKTNPASYPQHHLGPLIVKTHISRWGIEDQVPRPDMDSVFPQKTPLVCARAPPPPPLPQHTAEPPATDLPGDICRSV